MIKFKSILVIHEYGEPSHYLALNAYAEIEKVSIKYIEFSFLHNLYNSLKNRNFKRAIKNISDFFYLICIFIFPFVLGKKLVVIGMAPFDNHVLYFNRILKYARYIYHTSWTDWSGTFVPKKNKHFQALYKKKWDIFINNASAIATVTPDALKSLDANYKVGSKGFVVYHSYNTKIFCHDHNVTNDNKKIHVVFLGRLESSKGIDKIIELIDKNLCITYEFIGKGSYNNIINMLSTKNSEVSYPGFISNKNDIAERLKKADIILLPSIKTNSWEELFGIALIEAMACGCIPLVTDHKGPKTILNKVDFQKLIFSEELYVQRVEESIKYFQMNQDEMADLKRKVMIRAEEFSMENISKIWRQIITFI